MYNCLRCFLLFTLLACFHLNSFASENIFYVLRYKSSDRMTPVSDTLSSLKNNYQKIDILIPQAYSIDEFGVVKNSIEPEIYQFATTHAMRIMPLVTNKMFSREVAHQFLINKQAQLKAIHTLIDICKKNNFYGIQLDFEMINIEDRDALTKFFTFAAQQFHQNKLPISFAVAPVVTDKPTSIFLKKIYENWEGAYDFKKIGEVADFVSIMAYNQHGGGLTPGPTASLPWVAATVKYALQYIPSNKISIGIADYSTYWYTGSKKIGDKEKIKVKMCGINYERAALIAKHNKVKFIWDNQEGVNYFIFSKDWLNEYVFVEDDQSFAEKYKLVDQYKLRGISVFDLGTEDGRIWALLGK